jgi:signal transduction histidine kinase
LLRNRGPRAEHASTVGVDMVHRFHEAQSGAVAQAGDDQEGGSRAQEGLDFERLLGNLSAALIRVPVAEIDRELDRWLGEIVLAMGCDRGNVLQVDPADKALYTTHQWGRPGVPTPDRGLKPNAAENFPWITNKVFSGETLILPSMEAVPPDGSKDLASARRFMAKSNVTIPIRIGGNVVGAFMVGTVFAERTWSDETVRRLELIAGVLGNALERIRNEAEVRRLTEELRQVSRVVAMGELTASLAHELNQPLGAILNNARAALLLLGAKHPDLAEIKGALEDIVRDDDRAVEIVRNVRSMFQRGDTKASLINLKEILLDVSRIVTADARMKDIWFSAEASDSLPAVRGDKTHLTQAILNLVLNAFDAVCDGDGPRAVVLRATVDESNEIHVSVRDSGKGIDAKVMPHLFEPFFTTKPAGMGMGLAIVRSIVEDHGGRLWAAQNPDRGATLEFVLPVEGDSQSGNSNGRSAI